VFLEVWSECVVIIIRKEGSGTSHSLVVVAEVQSNRPDERIEATKQA
jgi:hypothetical protein